MDNSVENSDKSITIEEVFDSTSKNIYELSNIVSMQMKCITKLSDEVSNLKERLDIIEKDQ